MNSESNMPRGRVQFVCVHVFATKAASHTQGGVALVYGDSPYSQFKSVHVHGPNIISADIVSRNKRYGIVGAYIPPNGSTPLVYV